MVFAAVEGAVVVGGLSALGAAITGLGIPKDSVVEYEAALKADEFLLVAHGPVDEMARAKTILDTMEPTRLDVHQDVKDMAELPVDHAAHQAAG
jgi:alkyl hydroperoxide reductase subunit AhpF